MACDAVVPTLAMPSVAGQLHAAILANDCNQVAQLLHQDQGAQDTQALLSILLQPYEPDPSPPTSPNSSDTSTLHVAPSLLDMAQLGSSTNFLQPSPTPSHLTSRSPSTSNRTLSPASSTRLRQKKLAGLHSLELAVSNYLALVQHDLKAQARRQRRQIRGHGRGQGPHDDTNQPTAATAVGHGDEHHHQEHQQALACVQALLTAYARCTSIDSQQRWLCSTLLLASQVNASLPIIKLVWYLRRC
jgi:hypothetical protein